MRLLCLLASASYRVTHVLCMYLTQHVFYTVSKRRHPFYFCDIFVRFHPILLIFGINMHQRVIGEAIDHVAWTAARLCEN